MNKPLKIFALFVLAFYGFTVLVGSCWGETNGLTFEQLKINQEKYNSEKKDPWAAVGCSLLLPSLGHNYAGDPERGYKFIFIEGLGLGIMLIGGLYSAFPNAGGNATLASIEILGGSIFVLGKAWEVFDSYSTAIDFNKALKEKYGLALHISTGKIVTYYSYEI